MYTDVTNTTVLAVDGCQAADNTIAISISVSIRSHQLIWLNFVFRHQFFFSFFRVTKAGVEIGFVLYVYIYIPDTETDIASSI